jgi:hypothetical protein
MAWIGTSSINVAVSAGGAADLMWVIKSALLEAGWRLMSFGGGASSGVYQAPNQDGVTAVTDTLTTAASLNVNGAWFRIKEPGSTTAGREYVFQRGDAATELNVKYSYSSGFTGSHAAYAVGEQYAPTTGGGDGVSLFSTLTDSSVRASDGVATTLTTGRVHCVASSEANSAGVWEFYAFSTGGISSATPAPVVIYQAGLLPGSYPESDLDPSFRGVGSASRIYTTLQGSDNTVSFWNAYGTGSQGYVRGARIGQYYSYIGWSAGGWPIGYPATGLLAGSDVSIYDGDPALLPVGWVFSNDNTVYPYINIMANKGMPSNIHTFRIACSKGATFNLDTDNPKVVINAASTGLTAYTTIGLTFPWVRNVTPVF